MNRIGLIAEDESDVDVVRCVIMKMTKRAFSLEKFIGHGCGKLRNKCGVWAVNLRDRGCKWLIIVHDSDSNDPVKLKNDLVTATAPPPIKLHVIVIPVREIEAWLLADHEAIRRAMNLPKPMPRVANPEQVMRPKEYLRDQTFIRSGHRTRYVNSIHNKRIAEACSLANLRRCASFAPLEVFLRTHLG